MRRHNVDSKVEPEPTARRRLLEALARSIDDKGYRSTTVSDVVRIARASRRTFYEHFDGKEECFAALLSAMNDDMMAQITAAVDPRAPWQDQVKAAIAQWITVLQQRPAITLSWIRDLPGLGDTARRSQYGAAAGLVAMVQSLTDSDQLRTIGAGRASRDTAIMLIGGLRELVATAVEDGRPLSEVSYTATANAIAMLGSPVHPAAVPPTR